MKKILLFIQDNKLLLFLITLLIIAMVYMVFGSEAAACTFAIAPVLTTDAKIEATPGSEGLNSQTTGTVTTTLVRDTSPEMIEDALDRQLVLMRPDRAIVDTITRYAGRRKATSMEVGYYQLDVAPVETTLKTAYTAKSDTDTAQLEVSNRNIFKQFDTIIVPEISGYDDKNNATPDIPLMLYVTALTNGNPSVIAVNGPLQTGSESTYVPSIPQNAIMYRSGVAGHETQLFVPDSSGTPQKSWNFCQNFLCNVNISDWFKRSKTEVNWGEYEISENAIIDWKEKIEASILFGVKRKIRVQGRDGEPRFVYFTQGITNTIKKRYQFIATFTRADFVGMTKAATVGNSGSRTKILLCGSGLMERISNVDLKDYKPLNGKEVIFGIKWNRIETNFAEFLCYHYEFLDRYGWSEKGLVIDPEYINKWTFVDTNTQNIDMRSQGENVDKKVTQEVSCAILKYPSLHMIVEPVSDVARTTCEQIGDYRFRTITGNLPATGEQGIVYFIESAQGSFAANSLVEWNGSEWVQYQG